MAKKKRRRSAKKPAGESAKVREAVQSLRDYYQLGLEVLEADENNPRNQTYSRGVTKEFADRLGKARDYVDKARQFATEYSEDQFEELAELRRPDGLPLTRSHVIALLAVKHNAKRRSLQRKAATEDWSTRRLAEEISAIQGSSSSGGRRPREPKTVEGAVAQIVKMCERWNRWYEGFESDTGGVSLEALPADVAKCLNTASRAVERLRAAAGEYQG